MIEQKHLTYLDKLRDSGRTNMYGARPYLQRQFSIQKAQAEEILTYYFEHGSKLEGGKT